MILHINNVVLHQLGLNFCLKKHSRLDLVFSTTALDQTDTKETFSKLDIAKMSVALDSVMETQVAQLNLLLYQIYRPYFNGKLFMHIHNGIRSILLVTTLFDKSNYEN